MADRPYTVLSCCMSIDGYIDDAGGDRLVLSGADDLDRVDALRAECDAILVGAGTVRRDNPRLAVRAADRRTARMGAGRLPTPVKVTVTSTGDLDARAALFAAEQGGGETLVYVPHPVLSNAQARLSAVAQVIDAGESVDLAWVGADLYGRGVRRLLVEGGRSVHTQLLVADLVDELQLAVAPVFVGDAAAPRFVGDGSFPFTSPRRAVLRDVRSVGDTALMRYALSDRFPVF